MISLDEIALRNGADKSSAHHGYCSVYSRYFEHLRREPIVLLELGFGGYHYPDRGGAGAKMWAEYFDRAIIITTDIHAKNSLRHDRIVFYQGSQTDAAFLHSVVEKHGAPDIVVDDASHLSSLTIQSFAILFALLKPGGVYVIEDTHASYWNKDGFDGGDHPNSTLNYFKHLTDCLNPEHSGKVFPSAIQAIHFWKQQVFILKA